MLYGCLCRLSVGHTLITALRALRGLRLLQQNHSLVLQEADGSNTVWSIINWFARSFVAKKPPQNDASVQIINYRIAPGQSLRLLLRASRPKLFSLVARVSVGVAMFSLLPSLVAPYLLLGQYPAAAEPFCFVFVISLVSWAFCFLAVRDSFMLDEAGIYPPLSPIPFWWSELVEVTLKDFSSNPAKPKFSLLLISKRNRSLVLALEQFDRDSLGRFISAIERYAPSCRNLSLLSELPRFFAYEKGQLPNLSYGQLWESISNNRFELSCFTPLAPEASLQDGRITVKKQLSAGGFSAVYLVENDDQEERVLKEFVLPFGIDEFTKAKSLQHFQREARLLVKLNHPRLVSAYDYFVESGRHYLLLDYIKGPNLRTYVAQYGQPKEDLVIEWAIALAQTLCYLHEQDPPVIHRDISPDNIIIREDGTPFLIDFGAANEFVGSATGTLVGKHAYMAPEQIQGRAKPISDLYSLGATLYFCLTGLDPEPLRSATPKQFNSSVSASCDALIRSCTALDIQSRCSSARELIEKLSALSSYEPAELQAGFESESSNIPQPSNT